MRLWFVFISFHSFMMNQSLKGEEIYESDVVVDEVAATNQLNQFRDGVIDRPATYDKLGVVVASVKPEDAFQVFNGKLFSVPRSEYSLADSVERRVESPLQRFSRLRSELEELKSDLDNMTQAENFNSSSIWSVLQHETNKLVASTEILKNHESLAKLQSNLSEKETVLNNMVNDVKGSNDTEKNAVTTSKVVNLTDSEFLALEQRVYLLESVLGHAHNATEVTAALTSGKSQAFPLIDTIVKLEQRVSMFDSVNLDNIKAKTTALKVDLEATLKAKNSSTSADKLSESIRKVDELLESLRKVESVAEDLPTIVLRLKTLERIHLNASTFTSRLNQMENEVKTVAIDLQSNREVISALKTGFADNLSVMQQNVTAMDARLKSLSNK